MKYFTVSSAIATALRIFLWEKAMSIATSKCCHRIWAILPSPKVVPAGKPTHCVKHRISHHEAQDVTSIASEACLSDVLCLIPSSPIFDLCPVGRPNLAGCLHSTILSWEKRSRSTVSTMSMSLREDRLDATRKKSLSTRGGLGCSATRILALPSLPSTTHRLHQPIQTLLIFFQIRLMKVLRESLIEPRVHRTVGVRFWPFRFTRVKVSECTGQKALS